MAVIKKTLGFLPSIFRTDTNRKFLGSTLDQLISEPDLSRIDGYIGRQFSPTYRPSDNYVSEPTPERSQYQLEPAVVVKNSSDQVELYVDYNDIVDTVSSQGATVDNPDKLFSAEYYSFDPRIDLDKFVNYSQYYWLPNGPEPVTVTTEATQTSNLITIVGNAASSAYTVGGVSNPVITVTRGQSYTFSVNHPGSNFWIQTEPGIDGTKLYSSAVSSRRVYGVTNNGISTGSVTFTVPTEVAQDYYFKMPVVDYVDYAVASTFTSLDGSGYTFGVSALDGDTQYPDERYVVFTNTSTNNADWTDRNSAVIPSNQRRGIWRINVNHLSQIELTYVRSIPENTKVQVRLGLTQAGYEYTVNTTTNQFSLIDPITAPMTTLFYQNSVNPDLCGEIRILNQPLDIIDVDADILGSANYISPNGIVFTNGLKVYFDSTVTPTSYQNRTYSVEGVGTSIRLIDYQHLTAVEVENPLDSIPFDTTNFDTDGFDGLVRASRVPDYIVINRSSLDNNAWSRSNRWYHIDVITASASYNNHAASINQTNRAQRPIVEFDSDLRLFNMGRVGAGLVNRFYDADTVLVINGQAIPLSDISQVNQQKINVVNSYGLDLSLGDRLVFGNDTDSTVRRSIYRVDAIDQTAAVSFDGTLTGSIVIKLDQRRVRGSGTSFLTELVVGTDLYTSGGLHLGRVAAIYGDTELLLDQAPTQNYNTISAVKYNLPKINLVSEQTLQAYHSVAVLDGSNTRKTYYLNNANQWTLAQLKTKVNQEPLFEVLNSNNISFGNDSTYARTNFIGTKIFSYARGLTTVDPVLGFQLSYNGTSGTVGDINFVNNFETDQFVHTVSDIDRSEVIHSIYTGYLEKITSRTTFDTVTVWNKVSEPTKQYQHITVEFDGITSYFEIDATATAETNIASAEPNLRVYINNQLLIRYRPGFSDSYSYQLVGVRKTILIDPTLLVQGDRVDIFVYSDEISRFGYYTVPANLEYNCQNLPISTVTLGQMRNHLMRIGQNVRGLLGDALAANNLRDINLDSASGVMLQHSGGLDLAAVFLTDTVANFASSLNYAKREYTKFKNKFLELAASLPQAAGSDIGQAVDAVMSAVNQVKNSSFAWYYSDMVPYGNKYKSIRYTIINPLTKIYNISSAFNDAVPSNRAVLVYLNGVQLVRTRDYVFSPSPVVIIDNSVSLTSNDELEIREYTDTNGSYVPETPTKLGLYPKYQPVKYLDNTYRTPKYVIQGHDGSLTPAFNDFRDNLLLELENRIYNNLKVTNNSDQFDLYREIPGKFRTTSYSLDQFNQVINTEFLRWVGTNQVDFTTNDYFVSNDQFSWNYSQSLSDGDARLPGFWRGIYKYYYDTDRPHTHPWEMLGHSLKPNWWDTYYSWTVGVKRTALILAVTMGYTADPGLPGAPFADPRYFRADFDSIVPVDGSGNLIGPLSILVRKYNSNTFSRNFAVGDMGPVETAWRRSSEYPYALQKAMAVLRPAEYFGRLFDVSRFGMDTRITQAQFRNIQASRRVSPSELVVLSNTEKTSGYINWIHGYVTNLGYSATEYLQQKLANLQVNLGHRLAGFSDKNYITVVAEQISPASTSQTVIIPNENYSIVLNKSLPTARATYSAVIIEKTENGYTVSGYNNRYPYFTIVPSEATGSSYTVSVQTVSGIIYNDYKLEKLTVPYGFEFNTRQQVVDFLVSYQRYLLAQGFLFDSYDSDLGSNRDWILSVKEFLTWTLQGWRTGNILVLSPVGDTLFFVNDQSVVDNISNRSAESMLLGVNYNVIRNTEFSLVREGQLTKILTVSGQSIAFAELNLVQFEHVLIFDNVTVFDDIIYKPELGSRKYRLKLSGSRTAQWDGQLTPPGFVYSTGTVIDWKPGVDYRRGDIVNYKNKNYTAVQNITASDTFNFNYWTLADSVVRQGLLPNFAYGAQKLSRVYDIDSPPFDEESAKFSTGLIGYRSRHYLANLGMTETTQSKFYQGYITQKGTRNAIDALARAEFDGIANSIDIYEEWGARVGEFGAIDSNPAVQLIIDESIFNNNPITLEFLDATTTVSYDQARAVRPTDLLSSPNNYSPEIFLNRNQVPTETYKIELFGDSIMCGRNSESVSTSLTCVTDQFTARVSSPPDYLIYGNLSAVYSVAVTTRSAENSTSGNLLAGTDGVNSAWPDDIEADIVVINHGLMDAKNSVPLATYQQNLRSLRQALRPGQICLWQTPTQISSALAATWSVTNAVIGNYAQVMRQVAAEFHDAVADAYTMANWQNYLGTDGLHPTQSGYELLVNTVIVPELKKIITNKRRSYLKDYDHDLKSAGYVNRNDVDALVYSLANLAAIDSQVVADLTTGYKIWVAKDFRQDWQVMRAAKLRVKIINAELDLDRKLVFTTTGAHNLAVADVIAVRGVGTLIDKFYQVFAVDSTTITVLTDSTTIQALRNNPVTDITGDLFDFQNLRFSTIAELNSTFPRRGWLTTDLAWIDRADDDLEKWAVYQVDPAIIGDLNSTYTDNILGPVYQYSIAGKMLTNNQLADIVVPGDTIRFDITAPFGINNVFYTVEPIAAVAVASVGDSGDAADSNLVIAGEIRWQVYKSEEPRVDISSINNLYLYSLKNRRILTRLDAIDPAKGRVLGTAMADIDYTLSIDPARYSSGDTNSELAIGYDFSWAQDQLGRIWWDIDACRFIDYEQSSVEYRVTNWSQLFPGSEIHVYEWVSSDLLPSQHVAAGLEGQPRWPNDEAYTQSTYIDPKTNAVKVKYYYWLRGQTTQAINKTHSAGALANMIANPELQEIPYIAAVKSNTLALYNAGQFLSGSDTILYLSYQNTLNQRIVHTDYNLVQDGNASSLIPERVERKIIDSLVGTDSNGRLIPDPGLNSFERIGLAQRPRQTLIVNRTKAVENLVKYVNGILGDYPAAARLINRDKIYSDNFYAAEPEPNAVDYDDRVETYADFISEIAAPRASQRVLVAKDETQSQYWTLYVRNTANTEWRLTRRQAFDVSLVWNFVDWYADEYDATTQPDFVIKQPQDLHRLPLADQTVVKILNVNQDIISGTYRAVEENIGLFEIYKFYTVDGQLRSQLIGLENGTFQLKDILYSTRGFDTENFDTLFFDYNFFVELRYIMAGLKHDVFVADLAVNYNQLMFFIIDYILSEQQYIDWFFKTSLVTVLHRISGLQQNPGFIRDRQSYYENYIQEVKPYRTKIRQYILNYSEIELPRMAVTDFDLPAYYDTSLDKFRSPNGDYPNIDNPKFDQAAYRDWNNNYKYTVSSLDIAYPGYGYHACHDQGTAEPEIVVVRTDTETGSNAEFSVQLNQIQGINKVYTENTGSNYTQTPYVDVLGNGGTALSDQQIYSFKVSATGTNNANANIVFGLTSTSSNVSLYSTAVSGYTMHKLRRVDGQVTFSRSYNIPSQTTGGYTGFTTEDLTRDLNETSNDYVVVVHTSGNPEVFRLTGNLPTAMYRCGASQAIYGSTVLFKTGGAYLLVGIPGVGEGHGLENYAGTANNDSNAACWAEFSIRYGALIAKSTYPRNAYFNPNVTSSVTGDVAPRSALLVPRLTNNTVRKIKTVIRFDRIQYDSQVVDWRPYGWDGQSFDLEDLEFTERFDRGYQRGQYVSYQGQAYYLLDDMNSTYYDQHGNIVVDSNLTVRGQTLTAVPSGNVFDIAVTRVVGSEQSPSSRQYLHGYFDNANDRIMAYYQPGNNMTPKSLARLVPGIDPAQSIYGNTVIGLDTILVGDTFSSVAGIAPGNIKISGGSFVSNIFAHSPEELLPGQTFDTLTLTVTINSSIVSTNISNVAYAANVSSTNFGLFYDTTGNVQYFAVGSASTTLAQPLLLTDSNIFVVNGSVLAVPNPLAIQPGIIYVNGERIQYYVKDGNRLSQLRRGILGTGAAQYHPVGSKVDDVSEATEIAVIKV